MSQICTVRDADMCNTGLMFHKKSFIFSHPLAQKYTFASLSAFPFLSFFLSFFLSLSLSLSLFISYVHAYVHTHARAHTNTGLALHMCVYDVCVYCTA